jgi:hypothetical protein
MGAVELNPYTIELLKELMDAAVERNASEVSIGGFTAKFHPPVPQLNIPVMPDKLPAIGPVEKDQPQATRAQNYASLFGGKVPSFAVKTDPKVPQ